MEAYSRRENLKCVGIPESSNSSDEDPSKDTEAVVYKFMEEELSIEEPHKKIEFQRNHCMGKTTNKAPRPIFARFLRYSDREKVMQLAQSKLQDTDFAVYEDIQKDLYDLQLKQQKRRLKGLFSAKLNPIVFILTVNLFRQTSLSSRFIYLFIFYFPRSQPRSDHSFFSYSYIFKNYAKYFIISRTVRG